MPHIPLFASSEFQGKSAAGLYGDTIEEIDWSVGEILTTIRKLGLDDNTLLIFTSDNGPWNLKNGHGGRADPLRGFKFSTYEGGMRVPCIMRWPGKIPAGSQTDEIASTIDLTPTIAKLAGVALPQDRLLDGHDIWSLMTEDGVKSPHTAYFYYQGTRVSAIRSGNWKLRITPANEKKQTPKTFELFDLQIDIAESNNLAEQMPGKVRELEKMGEEFNASLLESSRPIGRIDQ